MVKQFHLNVDFTQLQSLNFVIENTSSIPTTPVPGQLIFYTGTGLDGTGLYVWDSTQWLPASTTTGSVTLTQYNHITLNHSDLLSRIAGNTIEPGVFYIIQDFQTRYEIDTTTYSGSPEPIAVLGLSNNTVSKQAWSVQYPQDHILYEVQPSGIEDRGYILYREDTDKYLSAYYDWRVVQFRRWNMTGAELTGSYTAWADSINIKGGTTVVPDSLDFEDYFTFTDSLGTGCTNIKIGNILSRYNNIVFRNTCNDIEIADSCEYMTITGFSNINIKIGRDSNRNIFKGDIDTLIANTLFNGNEITGSLFNMFIGSNFIDNEILEMSNCKIDSFFRNNQTGTSFNNNRIHNVFENNVIGDNFSYNQIESTFSNNTIGVNFSNNTILSLFDNNDTLTGFEDNTFLKNVTSCLFPSGFNGNNITKAISNDFTVVDNPSTNEFSSLGSTFETSITVPVSTVLDLSGFDTIGVFNISTTSTITQIQNSPSHSFELRPQVGQIITLQSQPYSTAVVNELVLPDVNYELTLNGDAGDWIRLRRDISGIIRQVDGQVYL